MLAIHRFYSSLSCIFNHDFRIPDLDQLLECAVDRRARLGALIKVNGGNGALADTFRSELEFL